MVGYTKGEALVRPAGESLEDSPVTLFTHKTWQRLEVDINYSTTQYKETLDTKEEIVYWIEIGPWVYYLK